MGKITLYFLTTLLVIISLDSVNINNIFKKNKIFQARLFYFFLAKSLIYLVTNFIYEIATTIKIF